MGRACPRLRECPGVVPSGRLYDDLLGDDMKQGIHPEYQIASVHCSCGNTFQTRSTVSEIRADICSNCHPFYTGKQKLVDTGGRVERFQRRYAKTQQAQQAARS
jgi:large subunit ribosomal protein L31